MRATLIGYHISPPISSGLICARRAFLVGLSPGAYLRGAYRRCRKVFSVKVIHNSQFASLNSKSNIVFDNNLYNNYTTARKSCNIILTHLKAFKYVKLMLPLFRAVVKFCSINRLFI